MTSKQVSIIFKEGGRFAHLADMPEFTAVAADGHTGVLNKASVDKALKVLLGALGPALCHLGTTSLSGQLDGKDVLALGVANQVDDGHVGSNFLLLSDKEDAQVVRS
jgi:hypothetical protein